MAYRYWHKSKGGFTLIELMVTISIFMVIMSIVLVALHSSRSKGRDTRRITDMSEIRLALEQYFFTSKSYPNVQGMGNNGYCGLITQPAVKKFISALPQDPQNDSGVCNGVSPHFYEYFTAGNALQPTEALLRVHGFEIPARIRKTALADDLDGWVQTSFEVGPASRWYGGAKTGLPACDLNGNFFPCYCNGCAIIDCGDAVNDTIYCVRMQ